MATATAGQAEPSCCWSVSRSPCRSRGQSPALFASLLAALAIAAVSILGCTAVALVGIGVWRLRRGPRPASPPPWQSIQPAPRAEIPKARRPAIEQPRELHLHLHGVSAEDVAAALRQEDSSGY